MKKKGCWKIKGFDTFSGGGFYPIEGNHLTEDSAKAAALAKLLELEISQPSWQSGGQKDSGIQDRVYVVRPDGTCYRYLLKA